MVERKADFDSAKKGQAEYYQPPLVQGWNEDGDSRRKPQWIYVIMIIIIA
ncbi:hypothetical protein LC586_35930 [Nostoc sp. CHAB 5714]|uniref:Uncharacterized protein n=1 Tax=Nostoc favosum CHAB5714 TaxID=2780399 RepID=A0ABS8IK82_9NOSO|nr:hypothetical protein [Nostoc favosum CHAB5714]